MKENDVLIEQFQNRKKELKEREKEERKAKENSIEGE